MNIDFKELCDLQAQKLVNCKEYKDGPFKGYSVWKYTKRVFWGNLWNKSKLLLEARGLVTYSDGWGEEVALHPFTKLFNYGENNTFVSPDKEVVAYKKVNGFMAAATKHNGKFLVSTTGSLDSEFVHMARESIHPGFFEDGWINLFEICHPNDPHIISEHSGVYYLASREVKTDSFSRDHIAWLWGSKTYSPWKCQGVFQKIFDEVNTPQFKEEGVVLVDPLTGEYLCKLKSPFYLAKKWMQRMGEKKASKVFENPDQFKQQIDEEFYSLFDKMIALGENSWNAMNEQEKSAWVVQNV